MFKQAAATFAATGLAIGALIVTAPNPAQAGPAESCAADVLAELDWASESAFGQKPVPSLTWEQAVRMCQGTEPDTKVYEDGSWVITDSDHEYEDYAGCLPGEACQDGTYLP